jgi:hypothetical protein
MINGGASREASPRATSKRASREEAYPVAAMELPVPRSPTREPATIRSLLAIPPSPRDLRLTTREQHKDSIADAQSMDFNNLEDCDRTMFRECIDGKNPLKMGQPSPASKAVEQKPKRQKTDAETKPAASGSEGEPSSREDGRTSDDSPVDANPLIESMDALTRGGLLQPDTNTNEALKRITDSLMRRANSSHSSEDPGPGSGRQSRRSNKGSHTTGGGFLPRGPSRNSLGSFGGSVADLCRLGALGVPRSHSISSSLSLGKHSVRETPPGQNDAFESYQLKMKCPAPMRARQVATLKRDSARYTASLSMTSPSPGHGSSSNGSASYTLPRNNNPQNAPPGAPMS